MSDQGDHDGDAMQDVDTSSPATPTTLEAPRTPGGEGSIAEPTSSPTGQTKMADYIRTVEAYQEQKYGANFRVTSEEKYQLAQQLVRNSQQVLRAAEGYALTNVRVHASKQKTATMAKDVLWAIGAMAGVGVEATEGLAANKIHTGPEWLVPGPNDTTTFMVACSKQAHRVAQRTQVRTSDGTIITAWSQWNPSTTSAVTLAEPATLIDEDSTDINRITKKAEVALISLATKHGAADISVTLSGRPITWGSGQEKRVSNMGKLWATQDAMNTMEARGLTNRRLDGGLYIFTDKRAAYDHVQENEKPIPTQKRNIKSMEDELDTDHKTVSMKWGAAVEDPENATNAWLTTLGLRGVHVTGMDGPKVMIKVPTACYRNLIGAKTPEKAVCKKTEQPKCTARDLERAKEKLQQMEQMEKAVAQCSNNQINAAVADAAVQEAIQQAAEQLAASTYQEQRGALMAAMQSRVQQAALMQNAKRAATEVGGQEPNAKRGPGTT